MSTENILVDYKYDGTKMIDFNPDVSAFKHLGDLIGKENAD